MKTSSALRLVGALVCDAGIAALGAYLLWSTGIITVANAPFQTFATVIVVTAALVVVRTVILAPLSGRHQGMLLAGHLAVLAAILTAWRVWDIYYLGWQAAYCVILLAIAALFGIFAVAVGRLQDGPRQSQAATSWLRAVVGAAAAGIGLAITAPVHEWDPTILNTVAATVVVALSAGLLAAAVIAPRATTATADTSPIADTAPNGTPSTEAAVPAGASLTAVPAETAMLRRTGQ